MQKFSDNISPEAIDQLARSSDGQALISLIQQADSGQLDSIQHQIQSGDLDGAVSSLQSLLSGQDAQAIIERLKR